MPSRRDILKAGGAMAAGGLTAASVTSSPASASGRGRAAKAAAAAGASTSPVLPSSERPFHRGGPGPLYWSTYGYSNPHNAQIPEAVWKANIDWIAQDLAPYGYQMVCTDGWIDGDQDVTRHGYIKSLSDDWKHDWAWWANYLKERNMQLGVYYNPLWVTGSAVSDRAIRVVGRPDVAVADLVNEGDWFDGGGQLQWVDATKDGAEEYVKGYVNYFRDLGAVFLRIDFLAFYETGFDQSEGTVGVAHGRDSYVQALQWMYEAAGEEIQLSLVMPNLFDHAAAERLYGDLIRIDNDVGFGTWYQLSDGRETWQPIWSQWNNAFQGFTGFSDVSGPGQLILDGDPLIMRSFAGADERQSAINLFVMAGAAIAIADQYNTIKENTSFYTNEEILEVRQAGLVGKPVYLNSHSYDWDQTSRDSQRWVGQLPDGSWVIGLFNRADSGTPIIQTLDFASILGLTEPAMVRDLWAHQDMGSMTSWSATLGPHASSLVKVTPTEPARYQAQVGTLAGTARFENSAHNYTGSGYVTGLDTPGSSIGMAIAVETAGTHVVTCHVANGSGETAGLAVTALDAHTGVGHGSGHLTLAPSLFWSDWYDVGVSLHLKAGTNLVVLSSETALAGLNVDSVTIT